MRKSEFGLSITKITAIVLSALMLLLAMPIGIVGAATKPNVSAPLPVQPDERYKLSKYDVLNIVVVGFPGIDVVPSGIGIGPDGYVNLPYVGSIKLAGLTVPEATVLLTEKLGEYVKIPSLSVMVTAYGPRKIYVMGEVARPGIYSLGSDYMNIFAAISSAGGITKRGRPKHIAIVRVVGGKVQMQEANFDRFVEKQDAAQNKILQDGDMVYVPRSNRIDINEDIMPIVNMFFIYKALK